MSWRSTTYVTRQDAIQRLINEVLGAPDRTLEDMLNRDSERTTEYVVNDSQAEYEAERAKAEREHEDD